MASEPHSSSPENGGSRPSTSRFVEGSMNDRVSAVPPPQFLGPNQLKEFERQFYGEQPTTPNRRTRRERPFSESNVSDRANEQEHILTHRKSIGLFARVRDVLGWNSNSRSERSTHKQDVARKHTSLQGSPKMPETPRRPEHLRAAKSFSEMSNLPQLSNFGVGGNRPTREDVLQSYNELMATGFFQSHAIQSTRHAAPGQRGNDHRAPPPIPHLPTIPGSASCTPQPPDCTSSIDATRCPGSPQSPSPIRVGGRGRPMWRPEPEPELELEPESENEFMPTLSKKISHYASSRGRKRNRADAEDAKDIANAEAAGASTSSSFAQPLKRVAKKLRKMPSPTKDVHQTPDGVIRLAPSTSAGGTLYLTEKPVRMRSPSPAPADVIGRKAERQHVYHHHGYPHHQHLEPLRNFSNSSRSEIHRLRKRGKSSSLRSRTGNENWEIAVDRDSDELIRPDVTATGGVDPGARLREPTPLSVIPDMNRGIPSVPRIPDKYHFYHKPGAQVQDENGVGNVAQFAHAL
ncbi:hypothetical protein M426DRAFT_11669 [Hypoxylon sp. CI-4A]|nr:hypothetical protein M426DRAFT_11669 [Hypoxylon sp. CI-4A]